MTKVVEVPNVRVHIPNPKGTSLTLYVPQYEVPLLKMRWKGALTDPTSHPIVTDRIPARGSAAARCEFTGRDKFAGMRHTRVNSLADEKRRLAGKYYEDKRTGNPIFDTVYPVLMFEETVQKMHPNLFEGEEGVMLGDIDAPEDILGQPEEAPELDDYTPPQDDADAITDDDRIADLCRLKYVAEATAKLMIEAGFDSVDEVAQTDPADLSQMVKGIGPKEAVKIIDHAVSLETGDGSAPLEG